MNDLRVGVRLGWPLAGLLWLVLTPMAVVWGQAGAPGLPPLPPEAYAFSPHASPEDYNDDVWSVQLKMYSDPVYNRPPIEWVYHPRLKQLWLEGLQREDYDMQRLAADCFSRTVLMDMKAPEAVAPLARLLKESPKRQVARAAARALVALEAAEQADLLWGQAQERGLDLAMVVEPALAKWRYEPVYATWLDRVKQPWPEIDSVRRRLAIEALGEVGHVAALPDLIRLAEATDAPSSLRLAAAEAVGRMHEAGGRDLAGRLLDENTRIGHLAAVRVLALREDDEALTWLHQLAFSPYPAAATAAYGRLLELRPEMTYDLIEGAVTHRDPGLRLLSTQSLQHQAQSSSVERLGSMLDDPNANVRRAVRDALLTLSDQESLREFVIAQATEKLDADDWRPIEQAAKILSALEQRQSIPRLVELLEHPQPRAFITAAWALKRLSPAEQMPELLKFSESVLDRIEKGQGTQLQIVRSNVQLAHLCELFGVMRYAPADGFLRRFIPKMSPPGPDARGAAIWSLGHIHEGQGEEQAELAQQLVARYIDMLSSPAEVEVVREFSAVTLGRMRARSAIPQLQKFAPIDNANSPVGQGAYWALNKITGDPIPPLQSIRLERNNWFLEPEPPK